MLPVEPVWWDGHHSLYRPKVWDDFILDGELCRLHSIVVWWFYIYLEVAKWNISLHSMWSHDEQRKYFNLSYWEILMHAKENCIVYFGLAPNKVELNSISKSSSVRAHF